MTVGLRQAGHATAALLLAGLWGCAELGGPAPDSGPTEISGNPNLRIEAGHFASAQPFGFGSAGDGVVGTVITVAGVRLAIEAVQPDPQDPDHEIELYRFGRLDANNHATAYCPADAAGQSLGFPMAGSWTADGAHLHAAGQISVACQGSPEARCVHLGYRPWRKAADGTSLWDYNEACARALRADYCGSGLAHSSAREPLALYDRLGIQNLQIASGMSFEAAWGAYGAVCVNHTRLPASMTLKDLRTECANLPKARLGDSCDERDPALIFTKSTAPPAS
jgi:hypothetical protein